MKRNLFWRFASARIKHHHDEWTGAPWGSAMERKHYNGMCRWQAIRSWIEESIGHGPLW